MTTFDYADPGTDPDYCDGLTPDDDTDREDDAPRWAVEFQAVAGAPWARLATTVASKALAVATVIRLRRRLHAARLVSLTGEEI